MPRILPRWNVFALLILGALLIGAIGIAVTLMRSDQPADADRPSPPGPAPSAS